MRNLHVFHLDVQSAGSLGDDGQSLCELQAVLSVLSQRLSFAIRLFGCLVSARELGGVGVGLGGKIAFHCCLPGLISLPAEHALHFFFFFGGGLFCSE